MKSKMQNDRVPIDTSPGKVGNHPSPHHNNLLCAREAPCWSSDSHHQNRDGCQLESSSYAVAAGQEPGQT
ncbi:hypothetical protein SMMN14_06969 [Sphaerulina musiva]